jgi:hypothetical protein
LSLRLMKGTARIAAAWLRAPVPFPGCGRNAKVDPVAVLLRVLSGGGPRVGFPEITGSLVQ